MNMITPEWYAMRPFRTWATFAAYSSAGYFACLNNLLSPITGNALLYNVYR